MKLDLSFQYHVNDVSRSVVSSFTKNVLFNPPIPYYDRWDRWNVKWKTYNFRLHIDMFWMREDSLRMAEDADLIYIGDDDMEFKEGSTSAINQCCNYMQENPDCGAIYLGGNFGGEGDHHKDEIYITNKGHLGTNRGILVRNRDEELLNRRLHAPGANFDAVIGFTALLQGYYIARRLHVPIEHHTDNVMKEDHVDPFYDINYMKRYGIMARVNEVIGDWNDHAVWPENIFTFYRQAVMRNGWLPKYDVQGNIEKFYDRYNI